MSPYEHGEVFVLDDGGEADLDLGNYERFMNVNLTKEHNITTGKIYSRVIEKERRGDYLGKTVQVVPHVTDALQDWIERVAQIPVEDSKSKPEVCLIELGGTVGDIESMVFLEALRQFRFRVGEGNFCHVHVSLVPVVHSVGQQKTKPTQHGIMTLRSTGHAPDIIACRATKPLARETRNKIALSCMVPASHVVSVHDVKNIYHVPLLLRKQRVPELILESLKINKMPAESLPKWSAMVLREDQATKTCRIAVVGKYTGLSDSYLSVIKALQHAANHCKLKLKIVWVESMELEQPHGATTPSFESVSPGISPERPSPARPPKSERHKKAWDSLKSCQGILIPGGFGSRGVQGKILAVQYARRNQIPFFGICLGMQVAVIEFARHVCALEDSNSTEFDQHPEHPVVIFMPEGSKTHLGGTMRLGLRKTVIQKGSLGNKLYGKTEVNERHRHRYEVNPDYVKQLEEAGLKFTGKSVDGQRMEITELKSEHPFFIGVQYHPEFKSRPMYPHPIFLGFIRESSKRQLGKKVPNPQAIKKLVLDTSYEKPDDTKS
uniref:CTP synthase n=1 Tax=Lotharella globosa TaxID=91324 RepID=A0A6V3IIT6_9EUKA|mmetsp:Transcript_14530/g.29375  ORF Transcript_14530/g.29375 Transcript_14530/m.29375 type:complete len:550 (+) Transcript_14530:283-1932(+)